MFPMVSPAAVMSSLLPVLAVSMAVFMTFFTLFCIILYLTDGMVPALFYRCRLVHLLKFLNGKILSRRYVQMV